MSQVTPLHVGLRPARALDVPRLVEVARASWLSAFDGIAPTRLVEWWRLNDREPGWYARYWPDMTVAEVGAVIVGVVQPAVDEVNGLWVAPEWQGLGIGSALLAEAERAIRDAGRGRVWLSCSEYNRRAMGFYESRGYRETSSYTEEISEGLSDRMVVFEKRL